jgi:hypothetical protein
MIATGHIVVKIFGEVLAPGKAMVVKTFKEIP